MDFGDSAQHRRALASAFAQGESDALFFGQGADSLAFSIGDGDTSAEERISRLLSADAADRGLAAARRRVVRRPLGGNYQAQSIVFSERERDALSSEPFSELLQLAASRSKGMPMRTSRDSTASSMLQTLTGLTADAERRRGLAPGAEPATPAQQLRASFVQELLLSTIATPLEDLDQGPVGGANCGTTAAVGAGPSAAPATGLGTDAIAAMEAQLRAVEAGVVRQNAEAERLRSLLANARTAMAD